MLCLQTVDSCTLPKVKQGGSLIVEGCMSAADTDKLWFVKGIQYMNCRQSMMPA